MANYAEGLHTLGVWIIVLFILENLILLGIALTIAWSNNERRPVRRPQWRTAGNSRPRLRNNNRRCG